MTNFDKITASPEVLGKFLAALPCPTGPWDGAFHRRFCDACTLEECPPICPHDEERNNPEWWLAQEAVPNG